MTESTSSAPHALRVETGGDSFPVAGPLPELSWQLPDGWRGQEGMEMEAVVDGAAREFSQKTTVHRFVAWPWELLQSRETVSWRVRVHSGPAVSAWSEWDSFEAGLFEEDWTGEWIASPSGAELPVGERPAFTFSTTFEVDTRPDRVTLYATALGVYDVDVNGKRVGRAELAPGTESYAETLYAQAYDVSDLVREGTNVISVHLSDGWYRGRAGAFRKQAAWGHQTAIRAEVVSRDADNSTVLAGTSTSWDVSDSVIMRADLMDGQITDLTYNPRPHGRAVPGPEAPPISWSPAPPVRVIEELSPVSITRLDDDRMIVDFGQNASGRVRLLSLGPAGTRTVLDYGEHLSPDGDLTLSHLDSQAPDGTTVAFQQRDEVVSDGVPDSVFEPRHTLHGFQYVRVQRAGIALDPADITMQVLHTDLDQTGTFECSDPDLTTLYRVADWSFRGNAVDVPTDCPTRERAGWTGDYQIFLPTAVRLYDVDGFSRKWLQSVRDDQLDDGRIVNISPDNARLKAVPDAMSDMATGSAGWGDAIVLVPWELYRTYGDRRVLEENWSAMTRWVQFALRSAAEARHPSRVARSPEPLPHEQYVWDGTFHFGEWLEPTPLNEDGTPGPAIPDPMAWAMADKGEVGTAYLYRSVSLLAKIAHILNRPDDAREYTATSEAVLDAWRTEFLTVDGRTTTGTQASYVRALAFNLAPDQARPDLARHLVNLIHAANDHLATGFLSTADLLPVLADHGYPEVAHTLLLQRTNPSWLGMLDRGATTIWEEWEGVDRNGRASASLNHYSKGAVIRYLQTHTLGLRQAAESTAWESFVVQPVIPEHLTWASGCFDSPQGRIEVAWTRTDVETALRVTVPAGSTARVLWADNDLTLGPGSYQL